MKCNLSDICYFVNEKISLSELTKDTYISTENMLTNRGGITVASALPSITQTQAFKAGDVLVSNIRPYFKKIWHATFNGGCSNDVLVFRAKESIDSDFLYYVLADDAFFNYATGTSKGTKMPRGDKSAIMQYGVPNIALSLQTRIAHILKPIDNKISLNNAINHNLEAQASELFDAWFILFVRSDGKMPADWHKGTLGDIAAITSGKRPPMKQAVASVDATIPLVGAASIMGFTNAILYNEPILVTGRVGTHGVVQRFQSPCWTSDNTLVIKSDFYEYTFQVLQRVDYVNMNRGSTQPLITQTDLKNVSIVIPTEEVLLEYEKIAGSLMAMYESNRKENERLATLRDTLLPKLMSGEIDVSEVEI